MLSEYPVLTWVYFLCEELHEKAIYEIDILERVYADLIGINSTK